MAKSAAPLLLVAGAAFLLMGGKKKKRGSSRAAVNSYGELPDNSPPALTTNTKKSSSGYSNVTRERMQWIQTSLAALGYDVGSKGMDGRYGADTKAAVWEFQTDHEDALGSPDGKPGKNTQAMLEQALAGRGEAQSQAQVPQDECDPLDPSTWGSGNICALEGGIWVRRKESTDSGSNFDIHALPMFESANEVIFNSTLTEFEIGATWRYATLDKWLAKRADNGWLATRDLMAPEFIDSSFDRSFEYYAENTMAAVGGTIAAFAGMVAILAAMPVAVPAAAAAALTVGTMTAVGEGIIVPSIHGQSHQRLVMRTGALALNKFVETQKVVWGQDRKLVKIKDLRRTPEVVAFLQFVVDYIARFQASTRV